MFCPSCRGEFREGFTWCQECEVALVETLPEEPGESDDELDGLEEPEELDEPEDAEPDEHVKGRISESGAETRLRSYELLLVLFVCFGESIVSSIHHLLLGERLDSLFSALNSATFIVHASARIALLVYVLSRRGRNLRWLGLAPRTSDVLPVLLLTLASFLPGYLASGLGFGWGRASRAMESFPLAAALIEGIALGPLVWVAILAGAAAEELIVRAYMITEVVDLTGGIVLAVLASTCFQALYHLYQGSSAALISALTFLIYSVYYVRTRRAAPVVLAHFLHNLVLYGGSRLH